jgi:hypothetical protein
LLFRASRDSRRADRWLDLRLASFFTGAVIAMAGIMLDSGWLVYIAVGVLVIGMILGLLARRNSSDPA